MNQTVNQALILRGDAPLTRDTRTVFALLDKLSGGRLTVRLPDGRCVAFGHGERCVSLHVHDERLFARVLARGDIGFAEAYLDGWWESPDLTGVLALLARNREVLTRAVYKSEEHTSELQSH